MTMTSMGFINSTTNQSIDGAYITGGIALILFGIGYIIREIKIFKKGNQDKLGYDLQGFIVGITCIVLGILMIIKH